MSKDPFASLKWRMFLLRWKLHPGRGLYVMGGIASLGLTLAFVTLVACCLVASFEWYWKVLIEVLTLGMYLFSLSFLMLITSELAHYRQNGDSP